MFSIHKEINSASNRFQGLGQRGFALVAALVAILVLTALGLLVFTITTQDVRVSSRTVGEKKAFAAAEAGLQTVTGIFNPTSANMGITPGTYTVDSTTSGDPATNYTITTPTIPTWGPGYVPIKGDDMSSTGWGRQRFLVAVTGTNTNYNSNVQVEAGIGYGPVPISTERP